MLLAVLSGFLVAAALLLVGRHLRGRLSALFALLPLGLCAYFAGQVPRVAAGEAVMYHYPWVPSLGVSFDFRLDGLSMLFCLLITGIGTLVFGYAAAYLKGNPYLDRFFGYLSMFMGAMLGLVLSDNVIALFVFWELTSITSFFLIGFTHNDAASRKSALLALAVTGGGGFLLMAGLVLMGSLTGSYSVQEMAAGRAAVQGHPLFGLVVLLVCAGAFTKSAQFPFHFWLPGAMKAPTPVSAYLHSATMVKAGVYLLARFTPVLGGHPYWNTTLTVTGGVTMVYAAVHALFRTDLKGILAYSTISALGVLVFLTGLGTAEAYTAAAVFILVHAFYKAALFLVTGIIDHETGTRDVTRLAGLRKVLLPVAVAGTLAALSGGGIPLTFGFIGKDLIYEATLGAGGAALFTNGLLTGAALLTNVLLLYAGFAAGIKPFAGKLPEAYRHVHLPPAAMWLPPLLLGGAGVGLGLFPGVLDVPVVAPVVAAMHGTAEEVHLKVWHGFNLTLLLSAVTLAAGVGLYVVTKPTHAKEKAAGRLGFLAPGALATGAARGLYRFSTWYTARLENGFLRVYLQYIVVFLTVLLALRYFSGPRPAVDLSGFSPVTVYEVVVAGVMLTAIGLAVFAASRLTAIAAMSVVGYCICLLFVFYSAPDLAMTQFTIDTLTVVLFVLVLFNLPPFRTLTSAAGTIRDAVICLAFGGLVSALALEVLAEPVNKEVSRYYAENAYVLAKGKNIVNVILVDFRGLDTMVEITVLTIAAIGVYSLLKLKIGPQEKE